MLSELNLATIDPDAPALAEEYGVGLELDEFCTAVNMDDPELFAPRDARIRSFGERARIFHAPFNELFPCAIDPQIRAVARRRLDQAAAYARHYGISRMVAHGNYLPNVYFPRWYVEQSIDFWKAFLADKPDSFVLCLENVLEPQPELLCDIVAGVNDPRCRLCLDIGHGEMKGLGTSAVELIHALGPKLQALHIHDNDRWHDSHQIPFSMDIHWEAVTKALADIGYNGWFTLEADTYLNAFTEETLPQGCKNLADSARKLADMFEGYRR